MKKVLIWGICGFVLLPSAAHAVTPTIGIISGDCEGVLNFKIPRGAIVRPIKTARGEIVDLNSWRVARNLDNSSSDVARGAARSLDTLPGGAKSIELFKKALGNEVTRFDALIAFQVWVSHDDVKVGDVADLLPAVLDEEFMVSYEYLPLVRSVIEKAKAENWMTGTWRKFLESSARSSNPWQGEFFLDAFRGYNVERSAYVDGMLHTFNKNPSDLTNLLTVVRKGVKPDYHLWFGQKFQTLGLNGIPRERLSVEEIKNKYRNSPHITTSEYQVGIESLNPQVRVEALYRLSKDLSTDESLALFGRALQYADEAVQNQGERILSVCSDEQFKKITLSFLNHEDSDFPGYSGPYDPLLNVVGLQISLRVASLGEALLPLEVNSGSYVLQSWALKSLSALPNQTLARKLVHSIVRNSGDPRLKDDAYSYSRSGTTESQTWLARALYDETVVTLRR